MSETEGVVTPWDTLVRRDDGDVAGWHDCLDGRAVSSGMSLELKLVDLPAGVPVRYERCGVSGEYVMLYANIGGHQFTCLAEPWMRFRWPAGQIPSAPMAQPPLLIGTVSRLVGRAPDTIRSWERLGQFVPSAGRLSNGTRLFTAEDVRKLRELASLKKPGGRPSKGRKGSA